MFQCLQLTLPSKAQRRKDTNLARVNLRAAESIVVGPHIGENEGFEVREGVSLESLTASHWNLPITEVCQDSASSASEQVSPPSASANHGQSNLTSRSYDLRTTLAVVHASLAQYAHSPLPITPNHARPPFSHGARAPGYPQSSNGCQNLLRVHRKTYVLFCALRALS
jgi:hypothetical protein